MNTTHNTAFAATIALPAAAPFTAVRVPAAPRRRSLLSVLRHRASLIAVLLMLGSSTSYCVYALGTLAR